MGKRNKRISSGKDAFDIKYLTENLNAVFHLAPQVLSLYLKDPTVDEVKGLLNSWEERGWREHEYQLHVENNPTVLNSAIDGNINSSLYKRSSNGNLMLADYKRKLNIHDGDTLTAPAEEANTESKEKVRKRGLELRFVDKVIEAQPHSEDLFDSYSIDLKRNLKIYSNLTYASFAFLLLTFIPYTIFVLSGYGPNFNPSLTLISSTTVGIALSVPYFVFSLKEEKFKKIREAKTLPHSVEGEKADSTVIEESSVSNEEQYENAENDLKEAVSRIASYELDPWKAISYPAFNDVSVAEVSTMLKQLKKAQRLKDSDNGVEDFVDAVDELWVDIQSAEKTAKKLAWDKFTVSEQKDFSLAKNLLKQIDDNGNTEESRSSYYSQLKRVIDRLNSVHDVVPAKVVGEIESKSRLEISADFTVSTGVSVNAEIMDKAAS